MAHFLSRNDLFEHNANILFTDEFSIQNQNSTKLDIKPITFNSIERVYIVFVYGIDLNRSLTNLNILNMFARAGFHVFFTACATIMLYFLRRGDFLRRNSLISDYVDVMIAVIGGGNLRYRNKLEKIFFGVLFLGSFYINAIGINFLFETFLAQVPERIDSIETLSKSNHPIFEFDMNKQPRIIHDIR